MNRGSRNKVKGRLEVREKEKGKESDGWMEGGRERGGDMQRGSQGREENGWMAGCKDKEKDK